MVDTATAAKPAPRKRAAPKATATTATAKTTACRRAAPKRSSARQATEPKVMKKAKTQMRKAETQVRTDMRKARKQTEAAADKGLKNFRRISVRAQETTRNVFLAGLGFYGKALEEAQSQLKDAQSTLKQNRSKAEKLFVELVKRGEKVEASAKSRLKDVDLDIKLPEFKIDPRDELRARLDKARESFDTLLEAISIRKVA